MTGVPRYLVMLPVYNGGTYLRLAINSVLAQTRSDWRLVILENASLDGSADLVRSYTDPRIELIESDRLLPIWQNWDRARLWLLEKPELADSLVTFIGHDDILYPGFLQAIEALSVQAPGASLYQTAFDIIDREGTTIRPCKPIPSREFAADFLAARGWGLRDSFGTGYAFRAADYLEAGGIPDLPSLMFSDDLLFARLSSRAKACDPAPGCAYRFHRGSASATRSGERLKANLVALNIFLEAVEIDFPDFAHSAAGRSATAALIVREALYLDSSLVRWALDLEVQDILTSLAQRYEMLASGVAPARFLGPNFFSGEFYTFVRQLFTIHGLARDRLRSRPRPPSRAMPV